MKEKNTDIVMGKLGKVADTLENASTQLSNAITQQQLDITRERISKCESDILALKAYTDNTDARWDVSEAVRLRVEDNTTQLEKSELDYSGMRALTISSFVLSVVCLVSVILCIAKI